MQKQERLVASIPASIRQVAEKEHLGEIVAVLDQRQKPLEVARDCLLGSIVLIGIIAFFILSIAFLFVYIYLSVIFIVLLVLVFGSIAEYQDATKRTDDQMVIYDYGLVALERGLTKTLRWEMIYEVFRGTIVTSENDPPYDIDTMQIHGRHKELYIIDDELPKHLRAKICDTVERGLIDSRLIWMEDVYERGGELPFGRLKLSKRGIDNGKELLPWSSVECINVTQEYVVIRREGRTSDWYNKKTPDVANACLLREMLPLLQRFAEV